MKEFDEKLQKIKEVTGVSVLNMLEVNKVMAVYDGAFEKLNQKMNKKFGR